MTSTYSYRELLEAYRSVGVSDGRVVYVVGNFGALGPYERNTRQEILEAHFSAITSIIGKTGTLVVPTHTFSLCNTSNLFSLKSSESETGPFSEFVRKKSGSVRQFHPFSSSTALGARATEICSQNTRHVYGPNSPFARMLSLNTLHVSVGMPFTHAVSLVHHAELIMGVPYRYTKEFRHRCECEGKISVEEFYLHVPYLEIDLVRDRNRRFVEQLESRSEIFTAEIGRSSIYAAAFHDIYDVVVSALSDNIYSALDAPPKLRGPFSR